MPVTSDTLFHFTSSRRNLLSILRQCFKPAFCIEGDVLIAMICFCDIPLSQTRNHIKKYGGFGIGLDKSWGIKKGLNPVLYIKEGSYLAKSLQSGHDSFYNGLLKKINVASEEPEHLLNLLLFNNAQADHFRYKKNYDSNSGYRYYDEREWRFVPPMTLDLDLSGEKPLLTAQTVFRNYVTPLNMPEENKKRKFLDEPKLSFEPKDVKYLLVKSEKDIYPLINDIRKIRRFNLSEEDLNILSSKILTIKSLDEDF